VEPAAAALDRGVRAAGGAGGAGGAPECTPATVEADCGASSTCDLVECTNGSCANTPATLGTPCTDNGGEICDGQGSCVVATCMDGVVDGGETDVDCGGACPACSNGLMCLTGADCASGVCTGGGCTPCGTNADCDPSSYCDGATSACVPDEANGEVCTEAAQCSSGACADGFCCDVACTDLCEACNVAGSEGACSPVPAGTDPASECIGATNCDGAGVCTLLPLGASCTVPAECASGTCDGGLCIAPPSLVINEIDYDQPGADTAEFVEIYNPGPGNALLSDWVFEHVNGASDSVVISVSLNDAQPGGVLGAGQYLVLCMPTVCSSLPSGTLFVTLASSVLQNGAPDGVRLLRQGQFADGVAYEGTMAGTGEGTTAGTDPGAGGLARCPNGADTDDNGADFELVTTLTPGAVNDDCAPPPVTFADVHPIFAAKCAPCHTTGASGGHSIGQSDVLAAYIDSQTSSYTITGTVGEAALFRIQNGSMPQGAGCTGDPAIDAGNPSCLTQAEQDLIQAWLDDGQLPP